MMDCMLHARVKPYIIIREMSTAGMGLQNGGCAGWCRRAVIGLGLILGPIPKEVWTGKYAQLCSKDKISYG